MDTGFASAWFVMGWNYLNDRMVDSARLAFAEALKRPDRLDVPDATGSRPMQPMPYVTTWLPPYGPTTFTWPTFHGLTAY